MSTHLQHEIEALKKRILRLATLVEESLQKAVKALEGPNDTLAREVIRSDPFIDRTEVGIEEECLKILALHQPVAIDLRFIVAVLKINNDLERVGDLSVNISERAAFLALCEPVELPFYFAGMAHKAQLMLKKSLDALVNLDVDLAREVRAMDDEVDEMNREMFRQVGEAVEKDPKKFSALMQMLSASRHLERVADHATNVAEDVIYMLEGEIVRHKPDNPSG